jgi:hypothetical protein
LLVSGKILEGLEAIYDIRKTTSLIIFLVFLTIVKPYISRKNIKIAKIISDKIENFCAPPLCRRAERKAMLKSSLITDIYPVR